MVVSADTIDANMCIWYNRITYIYICYYSFAYKYGCLGLCSERDCRRVPLAHEHAGASLLRIIQADCGCSFCLIMTETREVSVENSRSSFINFDFVCIGFVMKIKIDLMNMVAS